MKLVILSTGKVRQPFILAGEREYLQRIKGGLRVEVAELGLEAPDSLSVDEVKAREGREILKRLEPFDYIIALDERGGALSSERFARLLESRMNAGTKGIAIVIGGAYGLSESVRERANLVLSLSEFTLPHQLSRLVIVEQCYRAFTILKGIGYHK